MKLTKMHTSIIVLVACLPLLNAGKSCEQWKDCSSCASHKENGAFNFECRWCETTKTCHDFAIESHCPSGQTIDAAYDCPVPPQNGYTYTDQFGREKLFPLAAAAYTDDPRACLTNAVHGAQLKRRLEVHCDSSKRDTCVAFTGVSTYDKAIFVSFRGTTRDWQGVLEGFGSLFEEKKKFVGGGNVDAYFFDAFYALWDAGIRQDLLELQAQYPNYPLWVTGHSLGGAMASICAALIVKTKMWDAKDLKMVTFGQPRTGDLDFAEAHDQLLLYAYRVIHHDDLYPHLPPRTPDNLFDGFYHHRYEVWYDNDMARGRSFEVCDRSETPYCSNSRWELSPGEHPIYFNVNLFDWSKAGCPPSSLV